MTLRLLRREVLGGSHDRARLGHVGRAGTGDPEIGDLGVVGVVDDHVVGFQVAMDDAVTVGEAGRLEDLDRDVDRPQLIDRSLLPDQLLERAAREVLHRDVVRVVVLAAVVDADDVRVLEAGGGLGLAPEALDEARVLGEPVVQELQRDLAPELLVLGEEHIGHASGAEPGDDLVPPIDQRAAGELGHGVTYPRRSAPGSRPWRSGRPRYRRTRPRSFRS